MIPAAHLRLGNVVQVDGILVRVKAAHLLLAEQGDGMVPAEAVAIDQDVLALCGYHKLEGNINWIHPVHSTEVECDSFEFSWLTMGDQQLAAFRYLHELQNLLFAVSKKELQINLPADDGRRNAHNQ